MAKLIDRRRRNTCGAGAALWNLFLHPSVVRRGRPCFRRAAVRPSSKVILPYEPGYTGHWEMEKRRKETRDWLREREQQVRDRVNTPSIVPEAAPPAAAV
jgi:hypothetical protein